MSEYLRLRRVAYKTRLVSCSSSYLRKGIDFIYCGGVGDPIWFLSKALVLRFGYLTGFYLEIERVGEVVAPHI